MLGARADVVFTDPPYNLPIDGHVSGKGRVRHREFAMGSGEMTPIQFTEFLARALGLLVRHSLSEYCNSRIIRLQEELRTLVPREQ